MIKKTTSWTVLIYGLLMMALGFLGYYQSHSLISLYAGMGFGLTLFIISLLMFANVRYSTFSALILTLILMATFAIRYSISHKGIPAILSVLSGGVFLFLLTRVVRWKK